MDPYLLLDGDPDGQSMLAEALARGGGWRRRTYSTAPGPDRLPPWDPSALAHFAELLDEPPPLFLYWGDDNGSTASYTTRGPSSDSETPTGSDRGGTSD